jgi:hypothetical protein
MHCGLYHHPPSSRSPSMGGLRAISLTGAVLGQGDGWVDICALASEEIRGRVGTVGASIQEREKEMVERPWHRNQELVDSLPHC